MTVLHVAALLIYAFGVFAYGALLVLWSGWVRYPDVAPAGHPPRGGRQTMFVSGALWAVSFVWFATNLLAVAIVLDPAQPRMAGGFWLRLTIFWLAVSFPPLITHIVWAESSEARSGPPPPRGWGLVVWFTYVLAAALVIACTLGFVGIGLSRDAAGLLAARGSAALFIGAALYSIALLTQYPASPRAERDPRSTRWHIALFGAMALLFVVVAALDGRSSTAAIVGGSLEIAARSLPLVFMFVGTYFESRFEFFDIFVKRGLSLLTTTALLVLAFSIALPVLDRYGSRGAAPWLFAVALLPLAMALPWLHARIGATLDRRWLGRHFTTVDAVKHFLAGLRSATTEAQLLQRAETALSGIFDAPAAVLLTGTPPPALPFKPAEEVEIVSADGAAGRFLLGSRRNEAPYFSEDLALLGSLADVFAPVLDNLRLQVRELEQDRRARDLSLHASRSELKALRAQINPHFLFNALNAIAGLIHRDPAVADRTIEKLADVFRYTLRGAEAEWTLLEEELDFVRAYLDVEKARFGARLATDVRLAEDVRGARVPTMVVQTLVENAVKHGAANVRGQAVVRVSARRDGDRLLIDVDDNGPGFAAPDQRDATGPGRGGHGLLSIRRRLEGYFGDSATLVIDRDEQRGRTIVSIAMPFLAQDARPSRTAAGSGVPQ